MAREYMKVSGNAAYEMIGKKPTDKDGKIKKAININAICVALTQMMTRYWKSI